MAAGFRDNICWQKRVRNASAPTATGSRTGVVPAATALSIARRIDWARGAGECTNVDEQSIGKRGKLFRFLGLDHHCRDAPSASSTLAVKVCTTSLVIQCVSGERVRN